MNFNNLTSKQNKTREHPSKKLQQKGQVLVMTALMIVPLLGMGALVIDLGRAYTISTQMQHAADLASLAAVKSIVKYPRIDRVNVERAALVTALQNPILRSGGAIILPEDVELGEYNLEQYSAGHEKPDFTVVTDLNNSTKPGNAVRVTVRLGDGGHPPLTFLVARALHIAGPFATTRNAISVFGILNAIIAFDLSNSMVWKTYKKASACPSTYFGDNREFKRTARRTSSPSGMIDGVDYGNNCIGPPTTCDYYDSRTDTNPDSYTAVMPQPVTDITYSIIHNLLENSKIFTRYYRIGIDFFETEAYSTPDVEIAREKTNNKQEIIDYFKRGMLSHWCEYAHANDQPLPHLLHTWETSGAKPADFVNAADLYLYIQDPANGDYHTPYFPWPAGLKYWLKGSGWTNIGLVLRLALQQLKTLYDESSGLTYNAIFLLTDGQPTCKKCFKDAAETQVCEVLPYDPATYDPNERFWCSYDSDILTDALSWAKESAGLVKQNHIDFFGIYFATEGSCTDADAGYRNLKDIAAAAGGKAFCAENVDCAGPNCLRTILEELSRKPRFFLVPH